MKRPSFQFYPADWRKDMALQSCSVAARGLWIELMCIAHECDPYGHLTVNGRPMNAAQIGRHTGLAERECTKLITELVDAGVASRADDGSIFSRRMVRDEELRQVRANGGQAGAEHGVKGAEHGRKGGRPRKETGDKKPPLEPPPSSSSSPSGYVSDGAKAPSSSAAPTRRRAAKTPEIPPPFDAIVAAFHEVLPELPAVRLREGKTWEARKRSMRTFWRWVLTSTRSDGQRRATSGDEALAWIRAYFERARINDWLMGRQAPGNGHEGWRCDIDFLLSAKGQKAVIEKTEAAA